MAADNTRKISSVYAEALFKLACERSQVEGTRGELDGLGELVRGEGQFSAFLASPVIGRAEKMASLERIFSAELSELVRDFLGVLAGRDRLGLLGDIQKCYGQLDDQYAGRIRGKLTTAVELEQDEQIHLAEQIGRALRKTVSLAVGVDPSIIGGMVLRIEDMLIDGSVRCRLESFREWLLRQRGGEMRAVDGT